MSVPFLLIQLLILLYSVGRSITYLSTNTLVWINSIFYNRGLVVSKKSKPVDADIHDDDIKKTWWGPRSVKIPTFKRGGSFLSRIVPDVHELGRVIMHVVFSFIIALLFERTVSYSSFILVFISSLVLLIGSSWLLTKVILNRFSKTSKKILSTGAILVYVVIMALFIVNKEGIVIQSNNRVNEINQQLVEKKKIEEEKRKAILQVEDVHRERLRQYRDSIKLWTSQIDYTRSDVLNAIDRLDNLSKKYSDAEIRVESYDNVSDIKKYLDSVNKKEVKFMQDLFEKEKQLINEKGF